MFCGVASRLLGVEEEIPNIVLSKRCKFGTDGSRAAAAVTSMPGLIVDDTAILDDQGDPFGLDDDFEAPDDTRYVSDIHNPRGKPQQMVCAWMRGSRSACT
jgi:hypothetical protein